MLSQPAFTCSMLAIETLQQGVKYGVNSANFNFEHVSYLVFSVSIVKSEHVIAGFVHVNNSALAKMLSVIFVYWIYA